MKILEQLQTKPTGYARYDEFESPTLAMTYEPTGNVRPYQLDANEEWCLFGNISITFWANKAQFEEATKLAKRALVARLYGDILVELPELRLALSDGDKRRAFAVCDRIEDKLIGR